MAVELELNQEVATVVAPAQAPTKTTMPGGFGIGPAVAAAAGIILLLMMR